LKPPRSDIVGFPAALAEAVHDRAGVMSWRQPQPFQRVILGNAIDLGYATTLKRELTVDGAAIALIR
jgi:hypothetical protein